MNGGRSGSRACPAILAIVLCFAAYNHESRGGQGPAGRGTVVARAAYGSGPNQIGITNPDEANPEGPMSFALGADGRIYILDQVNARIQVFHGGVCTETIPIPGRTFVDIDRTPDGKLVLMDNLVKKAVYVLGGKGETVRILPLAGKGIADPAAVTGIECRDDARWSGIWAQVDEGWLRLAALDGTPDAGRPAIPGRPSLDGKRFMKAEMGGETIVLIRCSREDPPGWDRVRLAFDMPVAHLLGLWDDRSGRIYLGAFLVREPDAANVVALLDPAGKELGRLALAAAPMPHEVYRSVRVSPEGRVYQMVLEERGVVVRVYDPAGGPAQRKP